MKRTGWCLVGALLVTSAALAQERDDWGVLDTRSHLTVYHVINATNYVYTDFVRTADGGYAGAGFVSPLQAPGEQYALAIELDRAGAVQWQKVYGAGPQFHEATARAIVPAQDGGYYLAGTTAVSGTYDAAWLMKLDASGDVVWERTYGQLSRAMDFNGAAPTADGGLLLAGNADRASWPSSNAWVVKLDAAGSVVWSVAFTGGNWDAGSRVVVSPDGGCVLVGNTYTHGYNGQSDLWVIRLSGAGTVLSQHTYGTSSPGYVFPAGAMTTSDGHVLVTGKIYVGPGDEDAWAIKLRADGGIAWQKAFDDDPERESFGGDLLEIGGNYLLGGYHHHNYPDCYRLPWLLEVDGDGSLLWAKTYLNQLTSSTCYGASVLHLALNGWRLEVLGRYSGGNGEAGLWTARLDRFGDLPGCEFVEEATPFVYDTAAVPVETFAGTYEPLLILGSAVHTAADYPVAPLTHCKGELGTATRSLVH